jgi:hypothetical protein
LDSQHSSCHCAVNKTVPNLLSPVYLTGFDGDGKALRRLGPSSDQSPDVRCPAFACVVGPRNHCPDCRHSINPPRPRVKLVHHILHGGVSWPIVHLIDFWGITTVAKYLERIEQCPPPDRFPLALRVVGVCSCS